MIDVILAAAELRQEPDLIAGASAAGVRVVRRCVDAVDLLAAAAVDTVVAVVVSAGLSRLSADVVGRLGPTRQVIGLAEDPLDSTALDGYGVRTVVPIAAVADETWRSIRTALAGSARAADEYGVWTTGVWSDDGAPAQRADVAGQVIIVWGPIGSPGRTTLAMGLSEAIAESGRRVCLVDADTYAPSIALTLGIAEDSGGLLGACRLAENGLLDESSVVAATRRIRGSWHVLAGIPAAKRWQELSPSALGRVWDCVRGAFGVTVIDIGFCIEDDPSPAAWVRRRNCAAVSALAAADHVVVVADASAMGAARLISAWPALTDATSLPTTIVRNRSDGRRSSAAWDDALRRFGVAASVRAVPADAKSLDFCWSRGRSLGERARRSPLRRSLNGLAAEVVSG